MLTEFDLTKHIAIGADHAGFEYKTALVKHLNDAGYQVSDFGTYSVESVDYPDYAHPAAAAVESGECGCGILLCGSANGVAITANKHQHIRAGLAWQKEIAELSPEEMHKLLDWLTERQEEEVDRKLEAAVNAGHFDEMAARALENHKAGQTRPL